MTDEDFVNLLDYQDVDVPIIITDSKTRVDRLRSLVDDVHGKDKPLQFAFVENIEEIAGITSDRLFLDPKIDARVLSKLTEEQKKIWNVYFGSIKISDVLELDKNEDFAKTFIPTEIQNRQSDWLLAALVAAAAFWALGLVALIWLF